MRLNVSSKRVRVSLSILRIASSSVVSAAVTSANWRSRYSLRSLRFLELVDGRQVHLAEFLEIRTRRVQRFFPGGDRGVGGQAREDFGELEARGGELFDEAFAAHARFLRQPGAPVRRRRAPSLTRVSASRRFSSSARRAPSASSSARRSVASSLSTSRRRARKSLSRASSSTMGWSPLASAASSSRVARLGLRALIGHALETDAHRSSRWSGATRCGSAGRGSRAARPGSGRAPTAPLRGVLRVRFPARSAVNRARRATPARDRARRGRAPARPARGRPSRVTSAASSSRRSRRTVDSCARARSPSS